VRIRMKWPDWIGEWIDLDTLKALSRHVSSSIGAIFVFKAIGLLVDWGFTGNLKIVLKVIDETALVGIMLWLGYQMAILLWRKRIRRKDGSGFYVLVA